MNYKNFKKWRKKTLKRVDEFPELENTKIWITNDFLQSCFYDKYTPDDCVNTLLRP